MEQEARKVARNNPLKLLNEEQRYDLYGIIDNMEGWQALLKTVDILISNMEYDLLSADLSIVTPQDLVIKKARIDGAKKLATELSKVREASRGTQGR